MTENQASVLRLRGISRHFGRRAILRDIDLDIAPGERVALRGANGSGKTTLLRIAAGSIRGTQGSVEVGGRIGYLPQDAPVYRELSVVDHLRFVSKVHRMPWDTDDAIHLLQDAGLARMADRPAGTLSRGQRQRLGITLTRLGNPDLLLLDEPWTALDAEGQQWLSTTLDRMDAAIFAAVHEGVPFQPDRDVLLEGGRIQ